MGFQIIEQPDGLLCVFSTGTNSIIIHDATRQQVIDYFVQRAADNERHAILRILDKVQAGQPNKVYHQFTMSYGEALAAANRKQLGDLEVPE